MNALTSQRRQSLADTHNPRKARYSTVKINKTYLCLYNVIARYIVVYGGRRSSKSWSVSQLLVRKAAENPGRKIVVMRKYATTIRMSVWQRILNALEEAGLLVECDINKSERFIILPNGSSFYFVGADDPQKLKSLEGATDVWLEETNEFDEIDLDTIDAGLSADVFPICQIWMTFNPIPIVEAFMPWLATRYIMKYPHTMSVPMLADDICILQTWYKDNAFCPLAIIKLFKGYETSNPELYTLWVLGKFTHLEGVIFKNWDIVDEVNPDAKPMGFGLDYGFSSDPAAVVNCFMLRDELWLDEVVYATDLTNPQLSMAMEAGGLRKRMDPGICDCAEPKSKVELQNLGWYMSGCDKGSDYKVAAIRYLQGFKIHITKKSANIIKEFSTWSWRKDKASGKFLPIPVDGGDHAIDATIYRTYTKREWGVMR